MRRLAESLRFLNQIRLILVFLRKEPEYQVIAYRIKRMIFPTAVISCSRVFYARDAANAPYGGWLFIQKRGGEVYE